MNKSIFQSINPKTSICFRPNVILLWKKGDILIETLCETAPGGKWSAEILCLHPKDFSHLMRWDDLIIWTSFHFRIPPTNFQSQLGPDLRQCVVNKPQPSVCASLRCDKAPPPPLPQTSLTLCLFDQQTVRWSLGICILYCSLSIRPSSIWFMTWQRELTLIHSYITTHAVEENVIKWLEFRHTITLN